MSKGKTIALIVGAVVAATAVTAHVMKKKADKTTYKAEVVDPIPVRKMGFYEKYIKRAVDVVCATGAIVVFSPLYLGVAALVKQKLGSPVLFTQDRPGLIGPDGKETVFKMYKFRTMTDERDDNGELLPDDVRLTKFGAWLRNTSLDELPEAFNILNGTMSVIGPRPQLVRDMVFMSPEQRARHTAKPGLSGLAQVNGRNAISWEDKINWDLKYIRKVSLLEDIKIIFSTVKKAFIKQEGITEEGMATAEDYGDYLLRTEKVDKETYDNKQEEAKEILNRISSTYKKKPLDSFKFSVSMCVYGGDNAEWFKTAVDSVLDQTLPPDEVVLVVDGPVPEDLALVISDFEQNPIFKVFRLEKNQGHGVARRIGLDNCTYDLVALMDADDISTQERFEKEVEAFKKNPNLTIVGSHITEFVKNPKGSKSKRTVKLTDNDIKEDLKIRCPMNQPTVMFNRRDIQSVGGYIDWFCDEDYYLWIRLVEAGFEFKNIDDVLVNMRVSEDSYQRRGGWKYFSSEAKLQRLMREHGIIGNGRYAVNVGKRLIVQVLMSNNMRRLIFLKFARS